MAEDVVQRPPLPVGSVGRIGVGWWGLLCFIATEAALFAYLLFSYAYLALALDGQWRAAASPTLRLALPITVLVILSSVAAWWGERGVKRGSKAELLGGLLLAALLGLAVIALELLEWRSKPFALNAGSYSSIFFVTTGIHLAHIVLGVLVLLTVLAWSALGYFDARRHAPVLIGVAYWHFVNVVWLALFIAFYVAPYLG
jgi:heme/copper-type cytochrome/quinol oxidase subunit 3